MRLTFLCVCLIALYLISVSARPAESKKANLEGISKISDEISGVVKTIFDAVIEQVKHGNRDKHIGDVFEAFFLLNKAESLIILLEIQEEATNHLLTYDKFREYTIQITKLIDEMRVEIKASAAELPDIDTQKLITDIDAAASKVSEISRGSLEHFK